MGLIYQHIPLSDSSAHRDLRCGLGLPSFIDYVNQFKVNDNKFPLVKLGKAISLEYGCALKEDDRVPGDYPVMGSNGTVGSNEDYLIEGPAIIVGRKGSAGEVTYQESNCFPIDTTFYVKQRDNLFDTKFLYYLLKKLRLQRLSLFKGVPGLNRYDAYEAYIPLVPLPTQQEILKKIHPIEFEIQSLLASASNPTDIINQAFGAAFDINFNSFAANILKQSKIMRSLMDISNNPKIRFSHHYSKYNVEMFERVFKDKKQWHPLSSVFTVSGGKRIPKGEFFATEDTEYKYLRPNEVHMTGVSTDEIPSLKQSTYKKLKRYRINTGEFAISIVGTLGKVCLVDLDELDIQEDHLILSENFAKLTPLTEIELKFYSYYFNSFFFQSQVDKEYTIRTQKKLGLDKFTNIFVPSISFDSKKLVTEINSRLDNHLLALKKISQKQEEINRIIEKAIVNT